MKNKHLTSTTELLVSRFHRSLFGTRNNTYNFWISLNKTAPNSHLLNDNIFKKTSKSGTFHLVSAATITPTELKKAGHILAGVGCLGGALYTVQAYPESPYDFRLHNFGSSVMDFRGYHDLTPYILQLNTSEKHIKPINYLGMGELFHHIALSNDFVSPVDMEDFAVYKENCHTATKEIIKTSIERYKTLRPFVSYKDALDYIQEIAHSVTVFKSLSYFYFEAVSLSIMLQSKDKRSTELATTGEYNNKLYIDMNNHFHKRRLQKRFASYMFSPTAIELQRILSEMQSEGSLNVRFSDLFIAIANNIIFYIGSSLKSNNDVDGMVFYDYCGELQEEKNYQTFCELEAIAYMNEFWKKHSIHLVYNGVIEKGELGVTPNAPDVSISYGHYNDTITHVNAIESLPISIQSRES